MYEFDSLIDAKHLRLRNLASKRCEIWKVIRHGLYKGNKITAEEAAEEAAEEEQGSDWAAEE